MNTVSRIGFMLLTLTVSGLAVAQNHYQRLVWSDEFNAPNRRSPDPAKWNVTSAPGALGNYNLPQNTQVRGGNLVMTASNIPYVWKGVRYQYRTAQLSSRNKFSQLYGRFEARMKVAYGQGIATAFWTLGDDYAKVGWPACGEIDVMENIGTEPSTLHGSVHGPGYLGRYLSTGYTLSQGQRLAKGYHIYAVEWDPGAVRFYVDSTLYARYTPQNLPSGTSWLFNHPFFMVFNIYVGSPGSWEGAPNNATVFPQKVFVDYVRVYQ